MTSRHPSRYVAMLHDLAAGVSDLHDFAGRHAMTRLELAKWTARPRHAAIIDELAQLAERRAALLLSTARADALRALQHIAIDPEGKNPDLARKACLDLLKIERLHSTPRAAGPARPTGAEAAGEPSGDELRAMMSEHRRQEIEDAEADSAPDDPPAFPAAAD